MKVPDLVEEDGAAVGSLELADLELVGAREGASLITKQLALEELARHAPGGLLGRRSKRLGLGANEGVDGLLELIEAQRLVEDRVRRERGGGGAVVSTVGDRDDGTAIPAVKLQTLNQLFGVGSVAREIDQREGEAAIRERLPGFVRGRDGDALVSADSQKAEESQLRCRVDFNYERSSFR